MRELVHYANHPLCIVYCTGDAASIIVVHKAWILTLTVEPDSAAY